jgi:RimJ/RimL family protein N-acetyltransferase
MRAPSDLTIRVLDSGDATALQELRLHGLQESPTAFGASYVQEQGMSAAEIAKRLAPDPDWSWILGTFATEKELIGTIGFRRDRGLKHAHKAIMWGFYVSEHYRGSGIGRRLLQDFINRAKRISGLRQLRLTVNIVQEPAIALYKSYGFEAFGRERAALKIDGVYFDEDYMVLRIGDGA